MSREKGMLEEFACIDPEVGSVYLDGYVMETLSEDQRQAFENHLVFCLPCQEGLAYRRWLVDQLQQHPPANFTFSSPQAVFFFETFLDKPLPVTSISTPDIPELIDEYQGKAVVERFAASTEASGKLTFPITVKYVDGQVIGQFHKRAGQLFYELKKSTIGGETFPCALIYTPPSDSDDFKVFQLREGLNKRLGAFQEFVPSETIQGMLKVMKQFQLVVKERANDA